MCTPAASSSACLDEYIAAFNLLLKRISGVIIDKNEISEEEEHMHSQPYLLSPYREPTIAIPLDLLGVGRDPNSTLFLDRARSRIFLVKTTERGSNSCVVSDPCNRSIAMGHTVSKYTEHFFDS